VGIWWNSNTISHHFLHLPFFRSGRLNRIYSVYLSVLLGIPQSVWRERHLAHHREVASHFRWTSAIALEVILVSALWGFLVFEAPVFFLGTYLPGYFLGLALCYLHGHFEHAGGTTSNYGAIYNFAFFNDGYHVEHHEIPSKHWTEMRETGFGNTKTSRLPAVFRWMEFINLEWLESLVLWSKSLQRFLLATHGRALQKLMPDLPAVKTITIVGGGMYPRTALLLRKALPEATIRVIDSSLDHLEMAKKFLDGCAIDFDQAFFDAGRWCPNDSELLVVPLSFDGNRAAIYRNPPASAVLVHDWIWHKRGRSTIISFLLLKRLNLVVR
jgi:Fatty acid desaturase